MKESACRGWSESEERRLVESYAKGHGPQFIAANILPHRSVCAIASRARLLGAAKKPLNFVLPREHYNPIRIPDEYHADLTGLLMGDPTPRRSAFFAKYGRALC